MQKGGFTNNVKNRIRIENGLDKLEKWSHINSVKVN